MIVYLAERQPTQKTTAAWLLATPDSFRSVWDRFNVDKSVVEACFQRVVKALNYVSPQFIKWPTNNGSLEQTISAFEAKAGFPNVIGAIDGCHIPIKPPSPAGPYYNRKKFASMVLQACCNTTFEFTHCFIGYPGSVHNARVLRESPLPEFYPQQFPSGTYIIGDSAYPVLPWLLPPYRDNGHLTNKQKNYNKIHSQTRHVIENAFTLLKNRWRRFKDRLDLNVTTFYAPTIIAGCTLHNLSLINDSDISDFLDSGKESTSLDEEIYEMGATDQCGLQIRDNVADFLADK